MWVVGLTVLYIIDDDNDDKKQSNKKTPRRPNKLKIGQFIATSYTHTHNDKLVSFKY